MFAASIPIHEGVSPILGPGENDQVGGTSPNTPDPTSPSVVDIQKLLKIGAYLLFKSKIKKYTKEKSVYKKSDSRKTVYHVIENNTFIGQVDIGHFRADVYKLFNYTPREASSDSGGWKRIFFDLPDDDIKEEDDDDFLNEEETGTDSSSLKTQDWVELDIQIIGEKPYPSFVPVTECLTKPGTHKYQYQPGYSISTSLNSILGREAEHIVRASLDTIAPDRNSGGGTSCIVNENNPTQIWLNPRYSTIQIKSRPLRTWYDPPSIGFSTQFETIGTVDVLNGLYDFTCASQDVIPDVKCARMDDKNPNWPRHNEVLL